MDELICKACCEKRKNNRIKCSDPQCKDIKLCLECFALGAEPAQHKRDHAVVIEDDISRSVFSGHRGLRHHSSSQDEKTRGPPSSVVPAYPGASPNMLTVEAQQSGDSAEMKQEGGAAIGSSGGGRRAGVWPVSDEEELLKGLDQFGLGNWEAFVASNLAHKNCLARFSLDALRNHYERYYIHSAFGDVCRDNVFSITPPIPPSPPMSAAASSPRPHGSPVPRKRISVVTASTVSSSSTHQRLVDHTVAQEGGPLSPSLMSPSPPINLSSTEARQLGFMPLRDDYEREANNEAEKDLAAVELSHADDDLDRAYKLHLTSTYRIRLRERTRVKGVVRRHQLVPHFMQTFRRGQPGAKKRSVRELRSWHERTKRLMQIAEPEELTTIFNNMQEAKTLRSEIKHLIRLRRHGLTRLTEKEKFDREYNRREKAKEALRKKPIPGTPVKRPSSGGGPDSPSTVSASGAVPAATPLTGPKLGTPRAFHLENGATPSSVLSPGLTTRRRRSSDERRVQQRLRDEIVAANPTGRRSSVTSVTTPTAQRERNPSAAQHDGQTGGSARLPQSPMERGQESGGKGRGVLSCPPPVRHCRGRLNGGGSPRGATGKLRPVLRPSTQNTTRELLSAKEKKLIRSIRMPPANYLMLKISIIKDYARRKEDAAAKPRFPSGFDKTHRRKILNFLQESGWIPST